MTDSDLPDKQPEPATTTYTIDATERPTEAVVRAVAAHTNTALLDLEPLYDVFDPTALDDLFDTHASHHTRVTFRYHQCSVTVHHEEVCVQTRLEK